MAVVDSSALIHLVRVGRLNLLKGFFKEIYITPEIFEEVAKAEDKKVGVSQIKEAASSWIKILAPRQKIKIKNIADSEKVEYADASIILLAEERKDVLLSNDAFLIKVANARSVECWWLTTFLLNCLRKKMIKIQWNPLFLKSGKPWIPLSVKNRTLSPTSACRPLQRAVFDKEEAKQILYNLVINKMHIAPDVYATILNGIDKL